MTTTAVTPAQAVRASARPISYERFAGVSAIAGALTGLGYATAFVVLRDPLLSALFLMLGGLLAPAVLVALYERVRPEGTLALWALILAVAGALGAAVHGGYDLANAIHPPQGAASDLPNAVDPRGLLTFGLSGVGLFVLVWLADRGRRLPTGLVYLGYLSALLSLILYLGRLIVLTPTSPVILAPALAEGFVVSPVWHLWLGLVLWRQSTRG